MTREITIDARWDGEARVWCASSADVPGLVVEAATWPAMIEEVRLVLPDLLELSGEPNVKLSLTVRAEDISTLPEPDGRSLPRIGCSPESPRLLPRSARKGRS